MSIERIYFDHCQYRHFREFQDRFDSIPVVHRMTVQELNESVVYMMA